MNTKNLQKKMKDTTTFRVDEETRENLEYLRTIGLNASKVFRKTLANFVKEHKEVFANK